MTKLARTFGRLARRPTGPARLTAALLAALGLAVTAAPAHAVDAAELAARAHALAVDVAPPAVVPAQPTTQAVDPVRATRSGGAAAPVALASGGAAAPEATDPLAQVETPKVEDFAPDAQAPAPVDVRPPDPPALTQQPGGNINVDIRVLSPGDDGDVVQRVLDSIRAPTTTDAAGPGDPASGADWDWNWVWTCGSDAHSPPTTADWSWNWQWDCTPAAAPSELPAAVRPPAAPSPSGGGRPPGDARDAHVRRPRTGGFGTAPGIAGPPANQPAIAPEPPTRTRAVERPIPAGARDGGPSQRLLFTQPLVGSAASTASSGGSSSVLLVVLLGALALIAPRVIEPAWMRARRLRSLIPTHRLERPG